MIPLITSYLMLQKVNMEENYYFSNLKDPDENGDTVNKKYVDTKVADLPLYVKRDGSLKMTGNLSFNNNRIYALPLPTGPQQPATKVYVDNALQNKAENSEVILRDGSQSMTGNLQMGSKI